MYIYICIQASQKITYRAFFTMSVQLCIEIYKRQDLNDNSNRDGLLHNNWYCMEPRQRKERY